MGLTLAHHFFQHSPLCDVSCKLGLKTDLHGFGNFTRYNKCHGLESRCFSPIKNLLFLVPGQNSTFVRYLQKWLCDPCPHCALVLGALSMGAIQTPTGAFPTPKEIGECHCQSCAKLLCKCTLSLGTSTAPNGFIDTSQTPNIGLTRGADSWRCLSPKVTCPPLTRS